MSDIYVVVADNDQLITLPSGTIVEPDEFGPIVFEQYTNSASLENIKKRAEQLSQQYGKCRIAKLEFIDI